MFFGVGSLSAESGLRLAAFAAPAYPKKHYPCYPAIAVWSCVEKNKEVPFFAGLPHT
jgi:hypothetical protein